ncbi:MAG: YicC family protein [Candidatus Zixiibacteriota bacterium]|nr:MAG: YicC family protein [candidate division Zixibacteria bacterium]
MVASMTGYGRAELVEENLKATVEISSVNNRFCEIQFRLPKQLSPLESKLKEMILSTISRGKINFSLSWEETSAVASYAKLNEEAADVYFNIMKELKGRYGLSGDVRLDQFFGLPDLVKVEKEEPDLEKAWEVVSEVTGRALEEFNRMRKAEGAKLAQDLTGRVAGLEEAIPQIEKLTPNSVDNYRKKLKTKITELLDAMVVDQHRIELEVALMAEKCDVTEECVRFTSHNQQFLSALKEDGPVGKRLTFLLQEMNREANTIGSKAADAEISQKVIFLKEEIEKIREQVQNIE